jgi:hypothetical protein
MDLCCHRYRSLNGSLHGYVGGSSNTTTGLRCPTAALQAPLRPQVTLGSSERRITNRRLDYEVVGCGDRLRSDFPWWERADGT